MNRVRCGSSYCMTTWESCLRVMISSRNLRVLSTDFLILFSLFVAEDTLSQRPSNTFGRDAFTNSTYPATVTCSQCKEHHHHCRVSSPSHSLTNSHTITLYTVTPNMCPDARSLVFEMAKYVLLAYNQLTFILPPLVHTDILFSSWNPARGGHWGSWMDRYRKWSYRYTHNEIVPDTTKHNSRH